MDKILVTGGSGFIGSHLIPKLLERGYDVYSFERYVTGRIGRPHRIKTVFGDLRCGFTVKTTVRMVQPDIVIHLASISPVSYSYDHPQEVMDTNLMGTINLAEACLREASDFKQFLFASTSETYGNNGCEIQVETNPQIPASPYAVSKIACEKYLTYMKEAYDFPMTILRPFNTFGRKRDYHFLIERTIVQMLKQDKIFLGDPTPIRDWLYVDDHVNGYLTCLDNEKTVGEVFNFCTGKALSVRQTADLIKKLVGFDGEIVWNAIPQRPTEPRVIIGSYEKAKKILDWHPRFTLEQGLRNIINYWRNRV